MDLRVSPFLPGALNEEKPTSLRMDQTIPPVLAQVHPIIPCTKPLVLKVWSLDHQYQHHLRTC